MSTKKHWTVQWLPGMSSLAFLVGTELGTALIIYSPSSIAGVRLWRPLLGAALFFMLFCLRSYGDNRSAR